MVTNIYNRFFTFYVASENVRNYFSAILLALVNTLNYMDRYMIFSVLSDIQRYYKFSDSQAGLLQTVFLISYIFFSLIFGALGDIISRKFIISLGLVLWCVFTLAGSFVPSEYWIWFYVTRSLVGIGEASISTLGFTLIGDYFTGQNRTRFLALFFAAVPIGSGLGYLVGPQVASYAKDWKWALRVTPGIGIISAILFIIIVKEPLRGQAEIYEHVQNRDDSVHDQIYNPSDLVEKNITNLSTICDNQNEIAITHRSSSLNIFKRFYESNIKYFFSRKSFIATTLGYSAVSFVTGSIAVWGPKYIEMANDYLITDKGHISNKNLVGLIFGILSSSIGLIGVFIGGEITSIFRPNIPLIEIFLCLGCTIIASISLFLTLYFSLISLISLWIFTSIVFLFIFIMWTSNGDILLRVIGPLHRSRASAMQVLSIHILGDATSPFIIGLISDSLKNENPLFSDLLCLNIALYITPLILVLGSLMYCLSIPFYIADAKKTINEAVELRTDENTFTHDFL